MRKGPTGPGAAPGCGHGCAAVVNQKIKVPPILKNMVHCGPQDSMCVPTAAASHPLDLNGMIRCPPCLIFYDAARIFSAHCPVSPVPAAWALQMLFPLQSPILSARFLNSLFHRKTSEISRFQRLFGRSVIIGLKKKQRFTGDQQSVFPYTQAIKRRCHLLRSMGGISSFIARLTLRDSLEPLTKSLIQLNIARQVKKRRRMASNCVFYHPFEV